MKTTLILCLALLPILASAQDNVFKAGAATSNITPPLGMTIVGNFAPQATASFTEGDLAAQPGGPRPRRWCVNRGYGRASRHRFTGGR